MSPRWLRGKRASIGRVHRRQQGRCERSICCTQGCASLQMCCTHISPKIFPRPCDRMPWRRNSSRQFFAGCLRRVMRPRACSNAQRFACACAAGGSQLRPICSDFLLLPPRKIGNQALQKNGTASSTRCGVPFALPASTAAGANPERATLVFLACLQRIRVNPFGALQARSRALPRATRVIFFSVFDS